jgi:hypothetical protein
VILLVKKLQHGVSSEKLCLDGARIIHSSTFLSKVDQDVRRDMSIKNWSRRDSKL